MENLILGYETSYSDGYKTNTRQIFPTLQEIETEYLPQVEASIISKEKFSPLFARNFLTNIHRQVLLLDCDSIPDYNAASYWLRKDNIKFCSIESNPGKYWIITDQCGDAKQIISWIKRIPGVDKKYTKIAEKKQTLWLRASPKNSYLPNFLDLETLDDFKNPLAVEWTREFYDWWSSEIPARLADLYRVVESLESGTVIPGNSQKQNDTRATFGQKHRTI